VHSQQRNAGWDTYVRFFNVAPAPLWRHVTAGLPHHQRPEHGGFFMGGQIPPNAKDCLLVDFWNGVALEDNGIWDLRSENLPSRINILRASGISCVAVIQQPELRGQVEFLWDLTAMDAAILVGDLAGTTSAIQAVVAYITRAGLPHGEVMAAVDFATTWQPAPRPEHTLLPTASLLATAAAAQRLPLVNLALALGDYNDNAEDEWEDCPLLKLPPRPIGSPPGPWGGVGGRPPHPLEAPVVTFPDDD
jgi:hypothetical protein